MFKFLKEKLKGAISSFSKKTEAEAVKEAKVAEEQVQLDLEQPILQKSNEKIKEDAPREDNIKGQPLQDANFVKDALVSSGKKIVPEKKEQSKIIIQQMHGTQDYNKPKESEQEGTNQKIRGKIETLHEIKPEIINDEIKKDKLLHASEQEKPPETAKKESKPGFFSFIGSKEKGKPAPQETIQHPQEKKGFFSKITEAVTTTKISKDKFEDLFSHLELILLENNVAVQVVDKIKNDLEKDIVDKPIRRLQVEQTIQQSLKSSIEGLFSIPSINLITSINGKKEKPFVIAFFGINGSGKTTSIAKLAYLLSKQNISCILAAADTFRAASIEQLQHHADAIGVKLIKHSYGADPAAVAFDAVKHAQAKGIDVVLIDTAGRLHSNTNLMQEMQKISRVAKPDLKLFIGESITGNDCVEQAVSFDEAVSIDGLILTKADVDEKGGAAISISYVTKKPILYWGMGQTYDDLKEFDKVALIESLGL